MLGQIHKIGKAVTFVLLFGFALTLVSCATKHKMALVDDPNSNESSIPWNKQEKWENTGPMSGLTDRR
jgi:hypothetical protein